MDGLSLDHVEHGVGFRIHGLQMAVWTENLQPGGEEQIDLARILAQGREAGRIPGNVECRPHPLLGVQRELRRSFARLVTVSGAGQSGEAALLACLLLFLFLQSVIGLLFQHPGKIGKRLAAQGTVDEKDDQQRESEGGRVDHAANPAPARLQGIVKNLFGHLGVSLHPKVRAAGGQTELSGGRAYPRRIPMARSKSVSENSVVPPGLESLGPLFPALKRWAKLVRPSGAGFPSDSERRTE